MTALPLTLVIRADATAQVGAGHVMRCLALAAAWRGRHGPVSLWGELSLPFVRRRVDEMAIDVRAERPETADVLVVDSYDERERSMSAVEGAFGVRLLVDDFGGTLPRGYDAVWNPAPASRAEAYDAFDGIVMVGRDVVPVRQPLPRWQPRIAGTRSVAVMLGGSAITGELAGAVSGAARRVSGWAFAALGEWPPAAWRRLDPDAPWRGAIACDALVTAAGTTMLEAASTGIPVVVLQTAGNQAGNARWAREAGVPTIDLTGADAAGSLAAWLPGALVEARPLPQLRDGSGAVAAMLASLAERRRMEAVER